MGITLQTVTRVLDESGFKYLELDDEAVFLGIQGDNLEAKVILYLDEEGEYLDMRAVEFAECKADHPNLDGVLLKLAELNYKYRVAKFGWNPTEGEIKAEASIPLEDCSSLDKEQITMFLGLFFSVCDEIYPELERELMASGASSAKVMGDGFTPIEDGGALEEPTPEAKPGGSKMMSVGVLLLGLAALLGVLYLIFR